MTDSKGAELVPHPPPPAESCSGSSKSEILRGPHPHENQNGTAEEDAVTGLSVAVFLAAPVSFLHL